MIVEAEYWKPTGFREPEFYVSDVKIVGFIDGKLMPHAIFIDGHHFGSAPISYFRARTSQDKGEPTNG